MSFTAAFQAFYIENSSRSDFKEKPRQAQKREIKTKKFLLYRVPLEGEAHNRSLIYKCKRWSIFKAKHFLGRRSSDEILATISLARVLGFMAH